MTDVNPIDDELRAILSTNHTIAVVGASSNADRPSYGVLKVLMAAGFNVIPVTPREPRILGRTTYPTLADIPEHVDIVDVFRRPEETPAIADEAVKIGAKVLWLQLGITNEEAATRARAGGLAVVMDLCIGKTTLRLGIKHPRT
jgi:predicted CoA-binding protein